MVCWKRSRKPWLCMIKLKDLKTYLKEEVFLYRINYRDWVILTLDSLLEKSPKNFWF